MSLPWLDPAVPLFPPASSALDDPNGLLAAGGALGSDWLLEAYSRGIFPWYETGQPILWWSPNPRLILLPDQVRVSKSLKKLIKKCPYNLTIDRNFVGVIENCGKARPGSSGTWITEEMQQAYVNMHNLGYAHSVEVWSGSALVGGLYGIALGKVFFGESMFSLEPNASKLALVALAQRLLAWDYELIDCQVSSEHLVSLGAQEINRGEFSELVDSLVSETPHPDSWQIDSVVQILTDEIE